MTQGGGEWRLWAFIILESLGSNRKWKQIFNEFVGYNNELGRKGRNQRREENEFFGKLGRQNQGKTHESKMIAKGKEKKKTTQKRSGTKTGQGARSSIHPFISSHGEPAETVSSVPLNRWENIDLKRLGNCSRSSSQMPESGFSSLLNRDLGFGGIAPAAWEQGRAGRVEARPGAGARRGGGGADAIITSLNKSAS